MAYNLIENKLFSIKMKRKSFTIKMKKKSFTMNWSDFDNSKMKHDEIKNSNTDKI